MSAISQAIREICEEKGIPYESVLETVEAALAAAYRKDFGEKNQNVKATFDPETGIVQAFDEKEVVTDEFVAEALREIEERQKQRELEEQLRAEGKTSAPSVEEASQSRTEGPHRRPRFGEEPEEVPAVDAEGKPKYNPKLHLALAEAMVHEAGTTVGATIRIPLPVPGAFGRMAAQTAKQVVVQRIREAERDTIYNQWKGREGEVITAAVQRRDGRNILLDLGPRSIGTIREEEQIPTDRYTPGTRVKCLLFQVGKTLRGPELLCSRTHPDLLRHLFSVEVPEVASGAVELVAVAREPGARAKVAVRATDDHVDPIGACIGQRGTRVQTIIAELSGEKIDIIQHDEDAAKFIANAMAPAKVVETVLDPVGRVAVVRVAPDQFSLAIGRGGQNVRLAARLTGWKITVREAGTEPQADSPKPQAAGSDGQPVTTENVSPFDGASNVPDDSGKDSAGGTDVQTPA